MNLREEGVRGQNSAHHNYLRNVIGNVLRIPVGSMMSDWPILHLSFFIRVESKG